MLGTGAESSSGAQSSLAATTTSSVSDSPAAETFDDPGLGSSLELFDLHPSLDDYFPGLSFPSFDFASPSATGDKGVGPLIATHELDPIDLLSDNLRNADPLEAHDVQPRAILQPSGDFPIAFPLRQFSDSLGRLPVAESRDRHSTRFIVQMLRSYPTMMLRRETFPPFIHAHGHGQGSHTLPAPLANGMAIAQLFASRTSETKPFLWHSVRSESRRAREEVRSPAPWVAFQLPPARPADTGLTPDRWMAFPTKMSSLPFKFTLST